MWYHRARCRFACIPFRLPSSILCQQAASENLIGCLANRITDEPAEKRQAVEILKRIAARLLLWRVNLFCRRSLMTRSAFRKNEFAARKLSQGDAKAFRTREP